MSLNFQKQFVDALNHATISDSRVKFFDDFLKISAAALNRDEQIARVFASDLDERCLRMAFIQLALYGIPAVVEKRDAITDELFGKPLVTPILRRRSYENVA